MKLELAKHEGTKLLGIGEFDGYVRSGALIRITVKKAFGKYGTIEMTCAEDGEAKKYFDGITQGQELLFEFQVVNTGTKAKTTRQVGLLWIAPVADPEKKQKFTLPEK